MTSRTLVVLAATVVAAAGCKSGKPVPCAQDGTCADGLACIAHVCREAAHLNACQPGTDCTKAGRSDACLRLDGARADQAICAPRCATDAECASGETCAPGTTLGGATQNGCLPACQLGVTACAAAFGAPGLECRVGSDGGASCTPGSPPSPTWALATAQFETDETGVTAGAWRLVEGGFEGGDKVCNQAGDLCIEGGFTP